MKKLGFTLSDYDACLYFKFVNSLHPLFVLLYVDDMLIICKSVAKISEVKAQLKRFFDMKDLGPAQTILGIRILRDRAKQQIFLSQKDYMLKILDMFKVLICKSSPIPLGGAS